MTGLYPHQTGVGHKVHDLGTRTYVGHLHDGCVTIAEVLRAAGYRTLMSGKWHVGERRPHWPHDRGFDRSFSLINGRSSYFRLDADMSMAVDGEPYRPDDDRFSNYLTDLFTDQAIEYLNQYGRDSAPLFLYIPYTAPHWPLHALPEDIDRYRGRYHGGWDEVRRQRYARMIELGVISSEWELSPPDDEVRA